MSIGSPVTEPLSDIYQTLGLLGHHGVQVRDWSAIRDLPIVGFHVALAIRRMVSGHENLLVQWASIATVAKRMHQRPLLTWNANEAQYLIQQLGLYTEVYEATVLAGQLDKLHDFDKPEGVRVSIGDREYMVVGADPLGWNNYPKTGGPRSITQVVVTPMPLRVRTQIKYGLTNLPGHKD